MTTEKLRFKSIQIIHKSDVILIWWVMVTNKSAQRHTHQLSPADAALLSECDMAILVRLSLWFLAWNNSCKQSGRTHHTTQDLTISVPHFWHACDHCTHHTTQDLTISMPHFWHACDHWIPISLAVKKTIKQNISKSLFTYNKVLCE